MSVSHSSTVDVTGLVPNTRPPSLFLSFGQSSDDICIALAYEEFLVSIGCLLLVIDVVWGFI